MIATWLVVPATAHPTAADAQPEMAPALMTATSAPGALTASMTRTPALQTAVSLIHSLKRFYQNSATKCATDVVKMTTAQ